MAGAAEVKQTHPVALAILQAVEEQGLELPATDDVHYELGYGIRVQVNGECVHVGSTRFMQVEVDDGPFPHPIEHPRGAL